MPGLRAVLDGGRGTVPVRDVLLAAVPGEGLPTTAGVAEQRYGNAAAERRLSLPGHSRLTRAPGAGDGCFERPWCTLCPAISGPRHRLR
jgi:hypothetical protein